MIKEANSLGLAVPSNRSLPEPLDRGGIFVSDLMLAVGCRPESRDSEDAFADIEVMAGKMPVCLQRANGRCCQGR